jgi:hypothetical protein
MMKENQIENEQPEGGNLLNAIPKKELVSAPAGYFDGFAEEMMSKVQSAPVLYSLEKKENWNIPAGYDDDLHNKVMAAVVQQHREAKVVPFSRKLIKWSAVAATVALLFSVGYYWSGSRSEQNTSGVLTAENTGVTEEYQHYLENELNMDDAIAYYVNEHVADPEQSEFVAEMDYLMAEEELELENY